MNEAPRPATERPRLYELNARAWLSRLSGLRGRRIRLGDVTDADLSPLVEHRFDFLWLMGVWTPGLAGRRTWRSSAWLRSERVALLPDGSDADIVGSPFAVAAYVVAEDLGGEDGLARLRRRLEGLGVGLVLDFVPNHTALDHPWVRSDPARYVSVDAATRALQPDAYFEVRARRRRWIAHGRDPNFPPWPDTAQLDYRNSDVHRAMIRTLRDIATRSDGVRCDMAMLVLDDVFRGTWGAVPGRPDEGDGAQGEFWWHAIRAVREAYPSFVFIAEAYWGLEWRLQQLGFDYTYDKTLLDRLVAGDGPGVAAHLRADVEFQRRSVRFLENHDEPRAAARFAPEQHRAAALVAATVPGLLMVHDGQLEGARIRTPVQLRRWPSEPTDESLRCFYGRLLEATADDAFRRGRAVPLEALPAWDGSRSHEAIVARLWIGARRSLRLAVANLAPTSGQCYLRLPLPDAAGRTAIFTDLVGPAVYHRDGDELRSRGLYLDLPPYGRHVFAVSMRSPAGRHETMGTH